MNLRTEQIPSKIFSDMNWLRQIQHPLKISILLSLKYSAQFVTVFFCHQQTDTTELEEFTKVNIEAFNSSIGIHYNDFINKLFFQKEDK